MYTNQAIRALKEWSPFGLCDGTLVAQNGKKSRTVGCAQGALAFGFLDTVEGQAWLKQNATVAVGCDGTRRAKTAKERNSYVNENLHEANTLKGEFADAVAAHYGMTREQLDYIPSFNDEIVCGNVRQTIADWSGEFPQRFMQAISTLRHQYEKTGREACRLAK